MSAGFGPALGDTIGMATGGSLGLGGLATLISVVALGVFVLTQGDASNNDDDDSTPGGGLMQPVA